MIFITKIKAVLFSAFLVSSLSHAGIVAHFDDLESPPPLNSATGLQFTNGSNSLLYKEVVWDANFQVVGDQYRVNPVDGPLFGIPNSGHYFVTNQNGLSGMTITTNKILTSAWFGRNQYYGYTEGGADQVTIFALHGTQELGSIVFDLPESNPGQPEPLSFVNTGSFSALSGITGYRIDRRELGSQSGHWIADDFAFSDAPNNVPEPGILALFAVGLALLGWRLRSKNSGMRSANW